MDFPLFLSLSLSVLQLDRARCNEHTAEIALFSLQNLWQKFPNLIVSPVSYSHWGLLCVNNPSSTPLDVLLFSCQLFSERLPAPFTHVGRSEITPTSYWRPSRVTPV